VGKNRMMIMHKKGNIGTAHMTTEATSLSLSQLPENRNLSQSCLTWPWKTVCDYSSFLWQKLLSLFVCAPPYHINQIQVDRLTYQRKSLLFLQMLDRDSKLIVLRYYQTENYTWCATHKQQCRPISLSSKHHFIHNGTCSEVSGDGSK